MNKKWKVYVSIIHGVAFGAEVLYEEDDTYSFGIQLGLLRLLITREDLY